MDAVELHRPVVPTRVTKGWAAVIAYVERQIGSRNGAVTLHFAGGKLKRIEVNHTEDAEKLMASI